MTEQRIEQIRLIVPLVKELAAARRVLVILDEARLLDAQLEVRLPRQLVRMFLSVIRSTRCRKRGWQGERARWEADLSALIDVRDRRAFAGLKVKFGVSLHAGFAYHVQREGLSRHGRDFVYLGYDLSLLATSQDCERWLEDDVFCFIGRPSL